MPLSAALQSKHRDVETCLCSFCRSPQGSATESCDDTPKWRKTLAAREEEEEEAEEEEEEAEEEEEEAEDIMKKLMFSPAKTIFKHKVESGVTPPGASANEQANIRLTKYHGNDW